MGSYTEPQFGNTLFSAPTPDAPDRHVIVSGRWPQFGIGTTPLPFFDNFNRHLAADGQKSLQLAYNALAHLCGRAEVEETAPHEEADINAIQRDAIIAASGAIGVRAALVGASNWETAGHGISAAAQAQPGSSAAIIEAAYPEYAQTATELANYRSGDYLEWQTKYAVHILHQMRVVIGAAARYTIEQMQDVTHDTETSMLPPPPQMISSPLAESVTAAM